MHWLTGTASTIMVGCVEGILGIRPDFEGLLIQPSIPRSWEHVRINKTFRGKDLVIEIFNHNHVETGYKSMVLNGDIVEGNYIKASLLKEQNKIELYMS